MLDVSAPTVKNLIGLLDGPAVVRKAVEAGTVSVSVGYTLSKLEPDEAEKRIEQIKKEAPRVVGKKRSGNGAKATVIAAGDSTGGANARRVAKDAGGGLRAAGVIVDMLSAIQTNERIPENKRMGAEAALMWVLGDEDALKAIL